MKIKFVKSSEMSEEQFQKLLALMNKSGAITTDGSIPQTGKDKALVKSDFSDEDYQKMCEENGLIPDGSHIKDETERKGFIDALDEKQKAKVADRDRILTFRGSDETVDRHGDIVRVGGWDLKNYKNNPVFLMFHDSWSLPAGRTLRVYKDMQDSEAPENRSLKFNVYFPKGNEISDAAFASFNDGLMNAVSVGFRVLDYNYPTSKEERESLGLGPYGAEIKKQELMELSAVPIPANPNARLIKSMDTKDLSKRLGLELPEPVRTFQKNEDQVANEETMNTFIQAANEMKEAALLITEAMKTFQAEIKNLEIKVELSTDGLEISPKEKSPLPSPDEVGKGVYAEIAQLLGDVQKSINNRRSIDG